MRDSERSAEFQFSVPAPRPLGRAQGRLLAAPERAALLLACALTVRAWAAAQAGASGAANPAPAVPAAAQAEGLRIPLESYENGQVKVQLVAKLANMRAEGELDATDVRIEFYKPDGSVEGTAVASRCRYNRTAGVATSDSDVRFERGGLVVSGTGFDWNASEQTVRIRSNARVVLPRNVRPLLSTPAKESETTQ